MATTSTTERAGVVVQSWLPKDLARELRELATAALGPELEMLAIARPSRPGGISDRAKDAWKPLLAVADLAAGEWPERARHAAQVLCGNQELDEQEIGIRLMGALRDAFEHRHTDKLTSFEFCDPSTSCGGAVWGERQ